MNIFALVVLILVFLVLFYGLIIVHDIPYEIAKKRQHPHQDAIHVAGWISLFTLHAIWPFLWIWSMLYKPGLGWGLLEDRSADEALLKQQVQALQQRIEQLEKEVRK